MSQSVLILSAIFVPVLWGLVLLGKPELKAEMHFFCQAA